MAERVSVIGRVTAICGAAMIAVPVIAQSPVSPKPRSGVLEPLSPTPRSGVLEPVAPKPQSGEGGWFSAWAAAHNVGRGVEALSGGSVRLIVRPTLSGQSLRVKLSNIRGSAPAVFSAAYVGATATGASVVTGTNRRLTFSGAANLTLAPDAMVWSDPLPFDVKAFEPLTVSLDIVSASDVSMDTLSLVMNYRAAGAHAADTSAAAFTPIPPNAPDSTVHEYPTYWLAAVDVQSRIAAGTIVAVGDSWIDGRCSTTENGVVKPDLYQRWIDVLAARLAAQRPSEPRAVVNAGIAGNRIIPGGGNGSPTLQRLDRDVLERAGATHVIFLQGMNDIGGGATAAQVTAAMQQVIDRVHAKGLKIVGGTLFSLARPDRAKWTAPYEAVRRDVNTWIRTQAKFDGVIDFDRLMSAGPLYDGIPGLKPEFACNDDVHPNAAAYRAMGEFVDLTLFSTGRLQK
jgi:lysophospholipase L1-like esterase